MTRKTKLFTTLFMVTTLITNAQTNKTMQTKNFTQEQQAVLNVILEMTSAFHKKDINGVMSSYENKAVIVFQPEKPTSNRAEILAGFNGFFAVNPHFEYSGHEVFVNENLAVHFAPWTMTGKAPDGTDLKQSGLSVAVLRKQPDGKWLMVFDNPFGQHLMDLR